MKKNILFLLTPILLMSGMISPSQSYAQTNNAGQLLKISPVILSIPLSPSDSLVYSITVENLKEAPLPLRINMTDFRQEGDDGGYQFTETRQNPLLQWITFSEQEFILGPFEKKILQMNIDTPQQITPGGYYGVVFFEPVIPRSGSQTMVATRVGMLVLGTLGFENEGANLQLESFSFPVISESPSFPLLLRLKNTGLNFLSAKPILTFSPLSGDTKKVFLEEKIIFPDGIRRWESSVQTEDVSYGIYRVSLSVSSGAGQAISREQWLVVLPFTKALGLGIGVISIMIVVKLRDRLKKAISELFSKEKNRTSS